MFESATSPPERTPIVTYGKKNTPPIDITLFLRSFHIARHPGDIDDLEDSRLFASPARPSTRSSSSASQPVQPAKSTNKAVKEHPSAAAGGFAGPISLEDRSETSSQPLPDGLLWDCSEPNRNEDLPSPDNAVARRHPTSESYNLLTGGTQDTIETAESHCGNQLPCETSEHISYGYPTPLTTIRRRLSSVNLVPRKLRKLQLKNGSSAKSTRRGDRFTKRERILTYRLKPRQQPLRLRTNPSARSKLQMLQLRTGPLPDVKFETPKATVCIAAEPSPRFQSHTQSTMDAELIQTIKKELSSISAPVRPPSVDESESEEVDREAELEVDEDSSTDSRSNHTCENGDSQMDSPMVNREMLESRQDQTSVNGAWTETMSDTLSEFEDDGSDEVILLGARTIVSPLADRTRPLPDVLSSQDELLLAPVSSPTSPSQEQSHSPELSDSFSYTFRSSVCGDTSALEPHGQSPKKSMTYKGPLMQPRRQQSILKNGGVLQQHIAEPGSTADNTVYNRNMTGETYQQSSHYFATDLNRGQTHHREIFRVVSRHLDVGQHSHSSQETE